jgi:N-acylglucosamine 2-epimerase
MISDKETLLAFYCDYLKNDLMRFWKKAIDHEYGGIFTCYSNDGSKLLSTDKYVWSQGRVIWMLSRYAELIDKGLIEDDRQMYAAHAQKTYEFIKKNAVLAEKEGVCAYLVERDGTKKESIPGKGYYTSFYVDCFVIMGFAELARVSGEKDPLEDALQLYDRTQAYLKRGEIVSEPYPIPEGYKAHAVPMIMCNVASVLYDALKAFKHVRYQEIFDDAKGFMNRILNFHYDAERGLIKEMVSDDSSNEDTLMVRHIIPGHAVESMWFCIKVAKDSNAEDETYKKIARVVKNSIRTGWDKEYGGLYHYTDRDGGKPAGRMINAPYDISILETWDTKLWWPHSEVLYTALLCHDLTGDKEFMDLYQMVGKYAFTVFPNPDKSMGEWIQILDRENKPLEKVVARPVKDPYHIIRDFMLIIELLGNRP